MMASDKSYDSYIWARCHELHMQLLYLCDDNPFYAILVYLDAAFENQVTEVASPFTVRISPTYSSPLKTS